jgi:hypothetical protein
MSSPLVTILPTTERAKFKSTMFAAELERLNVEGKKTRSVKLWGLRLPLSEAGRVALAARFA